MKLSIISPDLSEACFIYRGHPWKKLPVDIQLFDGKRGFNLWSAIMEADAVLVLRPFTQQQVEICKVIKHCGKKLLLDYDDDYTKMPPWNPNKKAFEGCLPNLQAMAQLADAVTVCSTALLETVAGWGAKRVVKIPNAIDDSFKTMKPSAHRSQCVLWRGSSTHAGDLYTGKDAFVSMNKTHEIVFVGAIPDFAHELKHRHIPVSDYAAYIATMNSIAPEYVFVPLADHAFNYAKSDIGAQEAYLIGAKLLHNSIGEYNGLPEVGETRWLSSVNPLREKVLNDIYSSGSK